MELDDLKSLWKRNDNQLEKYLRINEQILRQIKLNRTSSEFHKLINFEVFSAIGGFLAIVLMAYFISLYDWKSQYAIFGYISMSILLLYLIFSISRLTAFSKFCGYDESVVKAQKELALLKKRLLRFRNIELMTMPVCFITIMPILSSAIYHFDILQYPVRYIMGIIITNMIAIPLVIWMYKIFYEKRIASVEALLQSINDFEQEQ